MEILSSKTDQCVRFVTKEHQHNDYIMIKEGVGCSSYVSYRNIFDVSDQLNS